MSALLSNPWFLFGVRVLVIFSFVMGVVMYLVWAERRGAALIQQRWGPNRVGPMGLLQPIIDVIKLAFKEEIIPDGVDRLVHFVAPGIIFTMAITALAVFPYDPRFVITDVDFGVLFVVAVAGLGTWAVMLAGWSSGSKYGLLGGTRSAAQLISYELPIVLSVLSVVILAGSLSTQKIVEAQRNMWFVVLQLPAFLVYLIAMFAETNRLPFDFPEAEAELVAGYATEFSSLRFAWFFAGEYANMVVAAMLMTTLFFGGWLGPFKDGWWWFVIKTFFFLWLFIWVRWTYPRLRYDKLMKLAWKGLLPVALINLVATAALKVLL